MRTLFTTVLLVCVLSAQAFAWGPEGHHIVAEIAKDHLNPKARRAIVDLLGTDDLASAATWADDVRRERPETARWHFVDIPWDASGFDERRDCESRGSRNPASHSHDCVVDRIQIFQSVLGDSHATRANRVEALKFLVHLVADLHQPFHALGRSRGGNAIAVTEFGSDQCGSRPCNLHQAWDLGLLHHAHRSPGAYVNRLEQELLPKLMAADAGTPVQWANESFQLAHQVWVDEGGAIDEDYFRRTSYLLDRQLARAGLRLAALLNTALDQ